MNPLMFHSHQEGHCAYVQFYRRETAWSKSMTCYLGNYTTSTDTSCVRAGTNKEQLLNIVAITDGMEVLYKAPMSRQHYAYLVQSLMVNHLIRRE